MALKPLNSVDGFSVGETPANIILANGDITTTNLTANGISTLGNVGNVKITGGSNGQAIITDGSGNLSFAALGDPVTDYGFVTGAANTSSNYGLLTSDARSPTSHSSYTVAEAGNITGSTPGDMIFVSNESGGATMAFYDGTNWRRIQDRAIIS